jgi:hypothetical protein
MAKKQASCQTLPIDDTVTQEQPNWCWVACLSVARQRKDPRGNTTQCNTATLALQRTGNVVANQTCCGFAAVPCNAATAGIPSMCNVARATSDITLDLNAVFGFAVTETGVLTADQLRQDLDQGHLVGVNIAWNDGGGGHMVIVYGCSGSKFHVFDPCEGSGPMSYNALKRYDEGAGNWIRSWRNL